MSVDNMGKQAPKKTLRVARKVVAAIATTLGLGYIIWALANNWTELRGLSQEWAPMWIVLHFLAVMIFFGFFLGLWRLVTRACHIHGSLQTLILSAYLPNLYKYIPGKLWAVASRVELLASYTSASRANASAATVISYLMEIAGAAPFFLVVMWIMPIPHLRLTGFLMVLAPCALIIFFPHLICRGASWGLKKLGREPLPRDLQVRGLPLISLGFVLYWSAYAGSAVFLLRGLGSTDCADGLLTGCIMVAAWLIGFVSLLTPGGIGVREGVMAVLLTPVVGPAMAAVIPILTRMSWTVAEFVSVGTAILILGRHTLRRPQVTD